MPIVVIGGSNEFLSVCNSIVLSKIDVLELRRTIYRKNDCKYFV